MSIQINQNKWYFSAISNSKDFEAKMKNNDFSIECFPKKVVFSIETLIEEIKAVSPEKLEFEIWD